MHKTIRSLLSAVAGLAILGSMVSCSQQPVPAPVASPTAVAPSFPTPTKTVEAKLTSSFGEKHEVPSFLEKSVEDPVFRNPKKKDKPEPKKIEEKYLGEGQWGCDRISDKSERQSCEEGDERYQGGKSSAEIQLEHAREQEALDREYAEKEGENFYDPEVEDFTGPEWECEGYSDTPEDQAAWEECMAG